MFTVLALPGKLSISRLRIILLTWQEFQPTSGKWPQGCVIEPQYLFTLLSLIFSIMELRLLSLALQCLAISPSYPVCLNPTPVNKSMTPVFRSPKVKYLQLKSQDIFWLFKSICYALLLFFSFQVILNMYSHYFMFPSIKYSLSLWTNVVSKFISSMNNPYRNESCSHTPNSTPMRYPHCHL